MEYISLWARGLITLAFLSAFLEFAVLENSMKKYLRFISGLLIIFTLIKPISSLRNVEIELPEVKTEEYREKTDDYVLKSLEDERWKTLNPE